MPQILQAMDGQEALDLLETGDRLPDIVLLDVMMPGMSGYDVSDSIMGYGLGFRPS
jgi:CheY-like chemotaxis protein